MFVNFLQRTMIITEVCRPGILFDVWTVYINITFARVINSALAVWLFAVVHFPGLQFCETAARPRGEAISVSWSSNRFNPLAASLKNRSPSVDPYNGTVVVSFRMQWQLTERFICLEYHEQPTNAGGRLLCLGEGAGGVRGGYATKLIVLWSVLIISFSRHNYVHRVTDIITPRGDLSSPLSPSQGD